MPEQRQFRVGYAIPRKKEQTFIQPSLLDHAGRRGILFIRIDPSGSVPLSQQGPFDCILHKLQGEAWKNQLQCFSMDHPNVPIIDPIDCIEPLHNRLTMLQLVDRLNISIPPDSSLSFGVPNQSVVRDAAEYLNQAGDLGFPAIAKPLVADGSAESHELHLVFTGDGLRRLSVPVVLQEFVNHGGVVFKVYVVGECVQCVRRPSLPDISNCNTSSVVYDDPMPFSQISNMAAAQGDGDPLMAMPPLSFVSEMARELMKATGLSLFNFDLIKDARCEERYLVIDINYFPGYSKVPSYESILTDFLLDIIAHNNTSAAVDANPNATAMENEI